MKKLARRSSTKGVSKESLRLRAEVLRLQALLLDADETVRAIRGGEVDALVLHLEAGEQVFTLKGAESSYRVLVETMSEGAATFTPDGTILYCNAYFASMVDCPLERVMGAHIEDFIAPMHRERFQALTRLGRETSAKTEVTFGSVLSSRVVPVQVSLSPLMSEDGTNLLCLVATDLSAQKRSEEMLASERLATSVIEQATDAILVCDERSRIIRASKSLTGFSKVSPLFVLFRDAFPSPELNSIVTAALRGERSRGVAASFTSEDSTCIEVLASGSPLRGSRGDIVGAIVTITDVSDLRSTQRDLETAVRVRDEFVSIASHELRTPLTSLQVQLDGLQLLIERNVASAANSRIAKRLEVASRQTRRLGKLTDAILDISRLRTGRFVLEFEEFDLTMAAREISLGWSEEAARAGCEMRFHENLPSVGLWDRLRIEQALDNLISNATKYASGKPIDVTVSSRKESVCITVEDRGIGIGESDLARVFEVFERAVSAQHFGGLGLGLFITRKIVEACGGTIAVTSELGKGAIFRISLPIRTHSPPHEQTSQSSARAP